MKYNFLHYQLDTNTKDLYADFTPIKLTKVQYDLLLFLVRNQGVLFSKSEIFEQVWYGKHVTINSIDQIISKLRKLLNSDEKNAVIKTVYAKGVMLVPQVEISQEQTKKTVTLNKSKTIKWKGFSFFALGLVAAFFSWYFSQSTPAKVEKANVLLFIAVSEPQQKNNQDWLNLASTSLFDQLFSYENKVEIKELSSKPRYLNNEQFINTLWTTNPELKVIKTRVTQTNNLYNVSLSIIDKFQNTKIQTLSHQNLSTAITQASNWLSNEVNINKKNKSLIPDDSHILTLYMHGLSSLASNEFDKAENYFELCIKEQNDFHLARLKLAQVKMKKGKLTKALALLETITVNKDYPKIAIEVESIRGDIFDTQGQYQQAQELYLSIILKHQKKHPNRINPIRLNLSHTYTLLNKYKESLEQLQIIEDTSKNIDLLSHVYQKKASILLTIGEAKKAKEAAEKSLELFEKQNDLLGKAKIFSTLARITTHQSKYKESLQYLQQALSISKGVDFKLGTGAILNEMIYLLLVQGKLSQAWQANIDMEKIALEIGYDAMLQIAKQYAMDISRVQKKWTQAEIYLEEHLQLAKKSNNKKALIRNKVLSLDLKLDQNKRKNVLLLIEEIQSHIDQSNEIRLQPRLDKQRGRYYFLTQQNNMAIDILQIAKERAKGTEDGETIVEIHNLLAEHYISTNQIQKALSILENAQDYKPLPYPFLLLKSKANDKLGRHLIALDLVNECKLSAYENWTREDEHYLNELVRKTNN